MDFHKPFLPDHINSLFQYWTSANRVVVSCQQLLVLYSGFSYIRSVVLQKTGPLSVKQGLNHFTLPNVRFRIICPDMPKPYLVTRLESRHVAEFIKLIDQQEEEDWTTRIKEVNIFTIAVSRTKNSSPYWTLVDLYNTVLLTRFFGYDPRITSILLLDSSVDNHLDLYWKTVFKDVTYLSKLPNETYFRSLVWALPGHKSPLFDKKDYDPQVEDFKRTIQSRFHLPLAAPCKLVCDTSGLKVLFVWDKLSEKHRTMRSVNYNFYTHTERYNGTIWNLANSNDLITKLRSLLTGWGVTGVELAIMPIKTQIKLVSSMNILVGLDGPSLSYTLLLPSNAGVIQLFPSQSTVDRTVEHLAAITGAHFMSYTIPHDPRDSSVTVDATVVAKLLNIMKMKMCGH